MSFNKNDLAPAPWTCQDDIYIQDSQGRIILDTVRSSDFVTDESSAAFTVTARNALAATELGVITYRDSTGMFAISALVGTLGDYPGGLFDNAFSALEHFYLWYHARQESSK